MKSEVQAATNTARINCTNQQKTEVVEEHPARPTKAPALYKAGNVESDHVHWIKLIGW
jgi:hypothetical protein